MCLVSYIPLGGQNYILNSNRDESPSRALNDLHREHHSQLEIIFPKDIKGGSWIFTSSNDRTVCLLNGAKEKHKHNPPYKLSRGIMLKQLIQSENMSMFWDKFDLNGIEPFTTIQVDKIILHEIIWTGSELIRTQKDANSPHVWSSSPLYPPPKVQLREKWFFEGYHNVG